MSIEAFVIVDLMILVYRNDDMAREYLIVTDIPIGTSAHRLTGTSKITMKRLNI